MFKIIIVEDNVDAAEKLKGFLNRYAKEKSELFHITVFSDAEEFLDCYKSECDLVFMDIELPGMNGMTAAKHLREMDRSVALVFVTNMARYAVKGYEVDATDYLVKPIHYGDFELKLQRIISRRKEESDAILVVRRNGYLRLLLREIHYIEVLGHKLIFHTEKEEITGSGTLLETEEKLRDKGFLRCNKCYLVNQRHIAAIQGYTLVLSGGEELQISRQRKREFMSDLAEFMGNRNVL